MLLIQTPFGSSGSPGDFVATVLNYGWMCAVIHVSATPSQVDTFSGERRAFGLLRSSAEFYVVGRLTLSASAS